MGLFLILHIHWFRLDLYKEVLLQIRICILLQIRPQASRR